MSTIAESLHTAVEMERLGRQFYIEAADRVRDGVLQSIMVALARDEEAHERIIRRYYEALKRQKGWPGAGEGVADLRSSNDEVKQIVETTIGGIGADATFLSIYEKARDLEVRSRDFYSARAGEAATRDEREFFEFLAGVEAIHLNTLELVLEGTRGEAEGLAGR